MCDKQYIFISRDSNSSVYTALGHYLLQSRPEEWRKAKHNSLRFNLMLGDRNKLPYARLGQCPGFKQLVNYYRGSESICRKCSFVREMKRHCRSRNIKLFPWFPESFIIIPKQRHIKQICALSDLKVNIIEQDVKTASGEQELKKDPAPVLSDLRVNIVEQDVKTASGEQEVNKDPAPVLSEVKVACASVKSEMNRDTNDNNSRNTDDREELLKYCSSNSGSRIWIAKSSSGAKGEGIKISSNVEDLLDYIDHQPQSYIIQQYIDTPFLLDNQRKFDIRCWVLLDSNQQVYLYNQGVLRTASESYDVTDLTNIVSHLTNHNLQLEKSTNFGVYEEGNEMFYPEFNEYLIKTQGETMETRIIPQIKNIITSSFDIILQNLDTKGLDYKSFQLFGFDFLLDASLKVWLLEINGAPACAQKLLPDLIKGLVETAIDPIYSTSYIYRPSNSSSFQKLES